MHVRVCVCVCVFVNCMCVLLSRYFAKSLASAGLRMYMVYLQYASPKIFERDGRPAWFNSGVIYLRSI